VPRGLRVADVGCGTGLLTLTLAGVAETVDAVDASRRMVRLAREKLRRAGATNVTVRRASAQKLPFDDGAFDAAMAMMTVHQWPDAAAGLAELRRVASGPVVVLTFDPDALDRLWLARYAPEVFEAERRRMPPVGAICAALGGHCDVLAVPVPIDCTDGFAEAFYARPERLLEPAVRRAQSAWGFVDAATAERAVASLRADLASGTWDERYGDLREQPEFDGALRLIVGRRPG
jgi:SAM-dependent methyltransferase